MKAPLKTPPFSPAVTLKAPAKGAATAQARLMARAAEKAQSLLATSARVLVVYGEDGARLYCEPGASPEASASAEAEQDDPPSASSRRRR